jgi:alpha-tubulin N-acetyltransferase 1
LQAQGLGAVITTAGKLVGSDHRIYLAVATDRETVLGLLKVGSKHLFIRVSLPCPAEGVKPCELLCGACDAMQNDSGGVKEIDPLCALDFYVVESCQRQGIGNRLFEFMLHVRLCVIPSCMVLSVIVTVRIASAKALDPPSLGTTGPPPNS